MAEKQEGLHRTPIDSEESLFASVRSEVATGLAVFFLPVVAVAKAVAGTLTQPVDHD